MWISLVKMNTKKLGKIELWISTLKFMWNLLLSIRCIKHIALTIIHPNSKQYARKIDKWKTIESCLAKKRFLIQYILVFPDIEGYSSINYKILDFRFFPFTFCWHSTLNLWKSYCFPQTWPFPLIINFQYLEMTHFL